LKLWITKAFSSVTFWFAEFAGWPTGAKIIIETQQWKCSSIFSGQCSKAIYTFSVVKVSLNNKCLHINECCCHHSGSSEHQISNCSPWWVRASASRQFPARENVSKM
jgi:hypothetical protein